jgi:hypothetical protein
VVIGAYEAVSWRNLASYLYGEGRQNAKDASLETLHTTDWILGQVIRCY